MPHKYRLGEVEGGGEVGGGKVRTKWEGRLTVEKDEGVGRVRKVEKSKEGGEG